MKGILLFIVILVFVSCHPIDEKTDNKEIGDGTLNDSMELIIPKPLFSDFDQVNWYRWDEQIEVLSIMEEVRIPPIPVTYKEKQASLLFEFTRAKILTSNFFTDLPSLGFSQHQFDENKIDSLQYIFTTTLNPTGEINACVAVFRDLIELRKEDSLVGFVKICFGCSHVQFIQTINSPNGFIENGKIEQLKNMRPSLLKTTSEPSNKKHLQQP